MKKNGLIQQVFSEADAFKGLKDMEALVEKLDSLQHLPIQPLFMAIQQSSPHVVAQALPKMSKAQRQAISDLSLWSRDKLDVETFSELMGAYANCQDQQTISEFVSSHDFLLFLKGRVNLHTFDAEDPRYPDHDYYFLTEDNLLLIEYGEDFDQVDELKLLIKALYSDLGVEQAYSLLFKYVADAFSIMEEEAYQKKTSRLRDYGFIDYYEALQYMGTFQSYKQLEKFVEKKALPVPNLSSEQKSQSLHSRSLIGYKSLNLVEEELSLIEDPKRLEFLRFHLLRFVNGTLTLNGALKTGHTLVSDSNRKTEKLFLLGYDYLLKRKSGDHSLFEVFDFFDCYKVGNSLISIEQKQLAKALKETIFEQANYLSFLGDRVKKIIENSSEFERYPKDESEFENWKKDIEFVKDILPYAQQFYKTFQELKESSRIHDNFYLNYSVDTIDFEALILSSLAGFILSGENQNKVGISSTELIDFYQKVKTKPEAITSFIHKFGMDSIIGIENYLRQLISEHLDGYNFDEISAEDFKHIGGPIILNHEVQDE